MYWSINSLPSWKDASKDDRKKAWQYGSKKAFAHWQTLLSLFVFVLIMIASTTFLTSIVGQIPGAMIGAAVGGFIFQTVHLNMAIPYIDKYLTKGAETES